MRTSALDKAILALLIALTTSPVYLGWYMMDVYATHAASVAAVVRAGSLDIKSALEYLAVVALYLVAPSLRPPLQILGMLSGASWVRPTIRFGNFPSTWSVLHGNILAVAWWETVGLMLLGLLCAASLILSFAHATRVLSGGNGSSDGQHRRWGSRRSRNPPSMDCGVHRK